MLFQPQRQLLGVIPQGRIRQLIDLGQMAKYGVYGYAYAFPCGSTALRLARKPSSRSRSASGCN